MRHLLHALRALLITIKNLFRRPVTVQFPEVVRPRGERYRASFALLHDEHGEELCIGCLACERICPSQVIAMVQAPKRESIVTGKKRGFVSEFTLDMSACIFCELCVQVCPEDAIIMTRAPEQPTFARGDLVLDMARLYANEGLHPASWANGTKLMAMQEPPASEKKGRPAAAAKAAPAPAPATGAPAAAAPAAEAPAAAAPAAVAPEAPVLAPAVGDAA
jgi:NADH-quinone oxidoreductase chain I